MKFFTKWYGRWIANRLEAALCHETYSADKHRYLCTVLEKEIGGIGGRLAAYHIQEIIAPHHTLHAYFIQLVGPKFPAVWEMREVYHRRFYNLMIQHFREGDLEWGHHPDLEALGVLHLMPRHIDERA